MRAAPAVSVLGSGGLPWRLARTLLPASAAAAVAMWLPQMMQWPQAPAAVAGALLVPGVAFLAWRLARPAPAALGFDGQRWTCDEIEGRVEVMLDLDAFLLLRWFPLNAGAPRWIACTAAEAGGAFHGLRVALYATSARSVEPATRG